MSANLDLRIVLDLNSLIPLSRFGEKLFYFPADNMLIRGFPIFFPLTALWFAPDRDHRRSRILVGLFTGCVATIFSVWLQKHTHFNVRPFLDPNLHLRGMDLVSTHGWDHLSSFPSDTGTLLFSFSTVVFLENKKAGVIAYLWSIIIAGIIRVAVGWHYPTDVAGAFVLGCASVFLITRLTYFTTVMDRLLARFQTRMHIVHALMFFFLADGLTMFSYDLQFLHGIRDVYRVLTHR